MIFILLIDMLLNKYSAFSVFQVPQSLHFDVSLLLALHSNFKRDYLNQGHKILGHGRF